MSSRVALVLSLVASGCGGSGSDGGGVGGGGTPDATPEAADAGAADAAAPDGGAGGCEVGGGWGETVTLDEGAYPHVAIDPAGDIVAFWETRSAPWDGYVPTEDDLNSRVIARHKACGEPWGAEELVAEVPADSSYVEPGICPQGADAMVLEQWRGTVTEYPGLEHVAVDDSGHVLALWNKVRERDIICPGADPPNQITTTGMLSQFDAADGWAGREMATPVYRVQLAVNDAGRALAAWTDVQESNQIWAMAYAPGDGWSEPVVVHPAAGVDVRVALDAGGDGLLAWRDAEGIWAARYAGGAWSSRAPLGTTEIPFGDRAGPVLAMNDGGAALAVWNRCVATRPSETRCAIQARRFDPDAGWGAIEEVRPRGPRSQLAVVVDGSGGGTAAWIRSGTSIEAARLEAGSWQPPEVIAVAPTDTEWWTENPTQFTMAGDAAGNVLVAWEWMRWRCAGDEGCGDIAEHEYVVRRFEVGSGWGATESLLHESTWPGFYDSGPVRLAMNDAGQGVAVWTRWPRNNYVDPPTVQAKLFR